jgi:REP element-mobilizing transposase RayT
MQPEKLYHIYNHANGTENLFKEPENYRYFLGQWEKYIQPIADALAYCLMPNHFHFLIKIRSQSEIEEIIKKKSVETKSLGGFQTLQGLKKEEATEKYISLQFSHFFNGYTQAFNKKYERKGSLFIPNFKRKEITSDAYISRVIAYIHLNPVHHQFTDRLGQWPFCSYSAYTEQKKTLLNLDYALQWFGGREEMIAFHESYLSKTSDLEEGMI